MVSLTPPAPVRKEAGWTLAMMWNRAPAFQPTVRLYKGGAISAPVPIITNSVA
jgi:hypothetical protein